MDGKVKEVGRQTCRFFAHQKLRVDYLWNVFFESKRLMANFCFLGKIFFVKISRGLIQWSLTYRELSLLKRCECFVAFLVYIRLFSV